MVVVATSLPFWSVARSEPVRPVNQVVEKVLSVEVALAKVERPVKKEAPETERTEVEALPRVVFPVKTLAPVKVLESAR